MDQEEAEVVASRVMATELQHQHTQADRLQRLRRPPRFGKWAVLQAVIGFGVGAAIGYANSGHWLTAAVAFSGLGVLNGARRDGQA